MSSAIYPDPPRLVTAVCGHGEQQRLSNARLRLTFYNAPVAYCGLLDQVQPFSKVLFPGYSLARARARRGVVLVSPWVLGFADTTAMWVHIVIGIVVAVIAAIELWMMHHGGRLIASR